MVRVFTDIDTSICGEGKSNNDWLYDKIQEHRGFLTYIQPWKGENGIFRLRMNDLVSEKKKRENENILLRLVLESVFQH